ncbi:MAG: hypothetical protein KUG82_14010 [Pseudomonadales bacterium]|nr:hypothetical protein [Pseudomonadales bacterium]
MRMKSRYSPLLFATFSLLSWFAATTSTSAAERLFSFPSPPAQAQFKVQRMAATVSELRYVDVNVELLSRNVESFQLELFGGEIFLLKRTRYKVNAGRSHIWRGKIYQQHTTAGGVIEEIVGSAVFIIKGDRIQATIHYQNQIYKLEPTESGQHVLKKVNTAAFPKEHPDDASTTDGSGSSSLVHGSLVHGSIVQIKQDDVDVFNAALVSDTHPAAPSIASLEVIRTLVVYSAAAAESVIDIEASIDLAIANTNSSYANSDIDESVSLELVYSAEYEYVETGNIFTDLENAESDPYIQRLRDVYLADVVVFVVGEAVYCGLASSIYANTEDAFAIVYVPCLAEGVYSLAHEIGHLQGARHNVAVDSSTSPFAYGHGYKDEPNAFRTIMAYPCVNGEVDECPRIPYWSSASVSYLGHPTGIAGISDNARVLKETSSVMASLWVNYIPYNILYWAGFNLHEIGEMPLLSNVSIKTPSTISDGQPLITSNYGVFENKNLLFDAVGEAPPYREAVTFDIRDEVERLDIEMDLTTSNLISTTEALGFVNLIFDQPVMLSLSEFGTIDIDGIGIASFVDNSLIHLLARINFTDSTLEIIVDGNSVHQQILSEYPLYSIEVGISGSNEHQMALDNFLVTSNGIALSALNAAFQLDNAGAWTDGNISFAASFSNDGPNLAENVTTSIRLPAEVNLDSFVSDDLDCSYSDFIITCDTNILAANDEANVEIVVSTLDANRRIPFTLSVSSDSDEFDLDNNNKTLLLGGNGVLADLEVTISGSEKTVGGRINVTATITNNGSDSADNIVLTIPTPSAVAYESIDQNACANVAVESARVVCGSNTLGSGETFEATITYYSPFFFTKPKFNASVTSDTTDPDLANNNASGTFGGAMSYLVVSLLIAIGLIRRTY